MATDAIFGLASMTKPITSVAIVANGFWSTHASASPRGDWIVIALTQLAWDDKSSSKWFDKYDEIAAEAIQK